MTPWKPCPFGIKKERLSSCCKVFHSLSLPRRGCIRQPGVAQAPPETTAPPRLLQPALPSARFLAPLVVRRAWILAHAGGAVRTRPNLLADFHSLVPVLAALAGNDAATELREVARAITDVARWWP
jgi:hypothetical protein